MQHGCSVPSCSLAFRCSSQRWCCSRCNLHLWSLQEVSLSRYTGKLRLAENLFCRGFAPSFPIWLAWFRLKHLAAPLDYQTPSPTAGFVLGSFVPLPCPRRLAPLQRYSRCETAAYTCSLEISLAGHLKSGSGIDPVCLRWPS